MEETEYLEQKQWYQKQLHRLNQKQSEYLENAENQHFTSPEYTKKLFHQILDLIILHPNHTMDIYFKELPSGFHLIYQNHGRGNSFHTDVTFSGYVCR